MGGLSRKICAIGAAAVVAMGFVLPAGATGLPLAQDLAADAAESDRTGAAILVFYMSDSCPYCQRVEELYLEPMLARRTYGDRLLIRAVRADRASPLRDFAGKRTDHETFARREGAFVTPLVQLYAPDGIRLATPLIGFTSPDFYAGELEGRIEAAIARVPVPAGRLVHLPAE